MKALILGDIHGNWDVADHVIARAREKHGDITHIFNVGDLGDGWPHYGPWCTESGVDRWHPKTADDIPIHWCEGNHDNHGLLESGELNPRLIHQPRGSVIEISGWRILWMGGATSIDRAHRTPHVDWWPQEAITYADAERALSVEGTIDAVVSHDSPEEAPVPKGFRALPDGKSDRQALQAIWEHHNPRFWFHGHYHYAYAGCMNNTEFFTCPAIGATNQTAYQEDYLIWDGISAFPSW